MYTILFKVACDRPPPSSPQAKYDSIFQFGNQYFDQFTLEGHLGLVIVYITKLNTITRLIHENFWYAIVASWVSLCEPLAFVTRQSRFNGVSHVVFSPLSFDHCHENFKRRCRKTGNCLVEVVCVGSLLRFNLNYLFLWRWISRTNCSFFDLISKNQVTAWVSPEEDAEINKRQIENYSRLLISALKSTWNHFAQDVGGSFSYSGRSKAWISP